MTVDRQQGDIDEDHKNIANWAIEMAGVKEAINQFRTSIAKQGKKIVEGVQDALNEAPQEIASQVLDQASKNNKKSKALKGSLWKRIWGKKE